jgi:thiol-disulfide isomerase/thioredoxin
LGEEVGVVLRSTRNTWPVAVIAVASLLVLAGCSAGKDAVAAGSSYAFVAPGGKTEIFYDPPASRGKAPDLVGDDLARPGHEIRLSDYPGQVVVVNIWGSWCGPCRAEAPELETVYQHTSAPGMRFLGIDVRDTRSAGEDFVTGNGVTYPSIFDPAGRSLLALQGYPRNVVPSTMVLDREHRVAVVVLRRTTASELLPVVRRLAAETTASAAPTTSRAAG